MGMVKGAPGASVGQPSRGKRHERAGPRWTTHRTDSARHLQAGAHSEGESHFRVIIVSEAFAGQPLVQRHRMINEVLADLLRERVHALAITARTPDETP